MLVFNSQEYQLRCIIVHRGTTLTSGHFYTIREMNGEWYRFNDDHVTKVLISSYWCSQYSEMYQV